MNYKAILFDLDGTLTDPQLGICQCINYATEIYGVHKPLNELTKYIGPPLLDSLAELVGRENAEAALARYRERFSAIGLYENEIYPRVDETLKTLKEKGYILCTASSKPEIFVRKIMDHFDIAKYFDYIGGATLDESRGAKSDVIRYVLQQINADSSQVIMVGDTKFDLEGAQKINMDAIGVTYGFGTKEELVQYPHIAIIDDISDILKVL